MARGHAACRRINNFNHGGRYMRKERLQLFDDDATENGLFRLAGNIFEGTVQHAEALKSGVWPTEVAVGSRAC